MSLADRARKLASLTAAGAGAIALTSGSAHAGVITATPNLTLSFTSDSNPAGFHTPATRTFSVSALAPRFSAVLYSLSTGDGGFDRFANFLAAGRSTQFVNGHNPRIAAGKTWDQVFASSGTYGRLADRVWGNSSSTHGLPAGNGFYELFRFNSGGDTDYGWIEYNIAMTIGDSSLAANGPNLTVVAYAWDTDPAVHLAAGQIADTPEPAALAETALGALVLGAEGLRRWRKSRKKA